MMSPATVSVPEKLSSSAAPDAAIVTVEASLLGLGLLILSVPAATVVSPL